MLQHFGGDRRHAKLRHQPVNAYGIECYHVDARFSKNLEDIGEFRSAKLALLYFYCLKAIWCRFRYGIENFYYVPAPGKRVALFRDWLVMFMCRPFFKRVILHWHGGGMAKWLETAATMPTRSVTYRLMKYADLSIVLSEIGRLDAEKIVPRRVTIVSTGVPDPCPRFAQEILPRRRARAARLRQFITGETAPASAEEATIRVLFIAACSREKGLFDAVEGVALANEKRVAEKSPLRFHLTAIGAFASAEEKAELTELIERHGWQNAVEILGFVAPERKEQALRDADLFCFPTYYPAENLPNSLVEAMAFGLTIVTSRWRAVPTMLPPNYPGLVDPKSPAQVADALLRTAGSDLAEPLRQTFLDRFTIEQHLANIAQAIRSVEGADT